ncbi:MAG: V-type ATPase subunit [Candidatus Margulisbacteria bacterium]|nr:V-type ATPase subunit [Candidatus Margulisiibacteriota bacterium]MBU1616218.1 V-type ATPase subunit [Candidatus Margulisiibacteriota bacterium]
MVRFAFAIGRIRSLETQLLDESRLLRLVDAHDLNAAFLILREIPFHAAEIDKLDNSFDFELLLKNELAATKALIDSFAPGDELIKALWQKNDSNLALIDYIELLEKSASRLGNPLFSRYVAAYAALNRLKLDLLSGTHEPNAMIERFRYTVYARPVAIGLEELKKSGSLFGLEREIDNYLMMIMKNARYLSFGIEPLLGYLFAREHEVRMLRLVLTGKLLQVKVDQLRERLRTTYV